MMTMQPPLSNQIFGRSAFSSSIVILKASKIGTGRV